MLDPISPMSRKTLFAQYWERCRLHIPRSRLDWCAALPSVEDVDGGGRAGIECSRNAVYGGLDPALSSQRRLSTWTAAPPKQ